MNKLILCEGKTDAILLSYYLGKMVGWKYTRKGPDALTIQHPKENESILGVTWAIQFPEKVFSLIDEQINSVQWERYDVLKKCFGMLEEL